jgi:hypothetical protein
MMKFSKRSAVSVLLLGLCLAVVSGIWLPLPTMGRGGALEGVDHPDVIRESVVSKSTGDQPWQYQVASYIPPESQKKKSDGEPEPLLKSFMRQKLVSSNRILEGLVTDNFEMVEQSADELMQMSVEATWRVSNDALYRRYSTEFHDAVGEMKDKAQAKSSEGTSLAWMNVTMRCLKCHEWVRNTIIADSERRHP